MSNFSKIISRQSYYLDFTQTSKYYELRQDYKILI